MPRTHLLKSMKKDFINWETSYENPNKKIPVVRFHCQALSRPPLPNSVGFKYRLTFKTLNADAKLVSQICHAHGFHEVMSSNSDFNLMWTGANPKPHAFKSLLPHQKVNHFPRSYELTRKDRLYQNIERFQHAKGAKLFNFVPKTFVIPSEYSEFAAAHHRTRGAWIVKPVASSRGRGIFIVNHPNQVPLDEPMVVAKYIDNPLLVNGHKWDLRLYVAVTSYDPLVIYLYEEGLVRFATVRYDSSGKNLWNPCMHLCNYSINKYHSDYIKCEDPDTEDKGHKWSLSALLRHLKANSIDTAALMHSIEDVIIKSIISVEIPVNSACKMFVPHRRNCFEVYGFDILIDSELKPWLLEVNLSPSLNCDAPIDLKIKSALLCDLMTLIGIQAVDPALRRAQFNQKILNSAGYSAHSKNYNSNIHHDRPNYDESAKRVPKRSVSLETRRFAAIRLASSNISASQELYKIVKCIKEENSRRGGFVRVFPTADTWQTYGSLLEYSSPYNQMLHECLFPDSFKKSGAHPRVRRKIVMSKDIRKRSQSAGPHSKDVRIDPGMGTTHSKADVVIDGGDSSHVECEKENIALQDSPLPKPTPSELRVAQYEKPLINGYRTKLSTFKDPEKIAKKRSEKRERSAVLRSKIVKMIESGLQLSEYQSRKAFSVYLHCILHRLSDLDDTNNSDVVQVDLVLKFLQKAALSLREPYFLKAPSIKLSGKDRAAIVAKELNEFLGHYKRETEVHTVYKEDKTMIPRHIFEEFIAFANDTDLEDVLTLQTKLYRCAHIFLGKCLPPVTGRKNSLLRTAYGISPDRNLRDKQCSMRMNARANPPVAPQFALRPQAPSRCLDINTAQAEENELDFRIEEEAFPTKKKLPFEKAVVTRIGVATTLSNNKRYQEYPAGIQSNTLNVSPRVSSAPSEILPK
ncbi:tubulin polyglutamylase TTLL5 [Lepeophtheirus salmonis]|uniref:tubulin polyglutamylase TTLL5 n=1 Tax=Lepeophtheirus salmonis TaxID=72036 RepID=UPI001AEA40E5|nr:tubulin polyglutamylase TTLL5-like [Lepeophtheirus salmonis]XP_040571805.1 tubulin polyglutamylase TTLL5-like [Lepeophtheirus salmonis]